MGKPTVADIHSCSYYCERPKCAQVQRDLLRDQAERLALALDRYMAAVVVYNSNQWDRANIRAYDSAKRNAQQALAEYRGESGRL